MITSRTTIRITLGLLAAACAGLLVPVDQVPAQEREKVRHFAIIVNTKNRGSAGEIRRLFLKQTSNWSFGAKAKPLDRRSNDPAHAAFLSRVLGMSESQYANHWLEMKQKTGTVKPMAVSSSRLAILLVTKYPGAVSFIELGPQDPAPKGTRILRRF